MEDVQAEGVDDDLTLGMDRDSFLAAFAWLPDLMMEHAENLLPLDAVEMDAALEIQSPEIWDSFPLFQPIYDFLHTDYHLCDGKCQKHLQDVWRSGCVDVALMVSSIAQSVQRGSKPELWKLVNETCFLSLMALKEKWNNRDENGLIKVNKNDTSVVNIIQLMCSYYYFYYYYYALPIHLFFPENQAMSSKITRYISLFNIKKKKKDDSNQYSFAVIEHKNGPDTVIGPYYPDNVAGENKPAVMVHSEEQCINEIKRQIKNIKSLLIFTKFCPCVKHKGFDSCMSQLARFSEEMYNHQIKVYTYFQDFYAMGNIDKQLKSLKDHMIIDQFKWLKERLNEQHRRSKFSCFPTEKIRIKHSKTLKVHFKEQMRKLNLLEWKDISFILKFDITFPSTEMTLDEYESCGKQQADKLKIHVKKHYSEDISEKVCSLFHSVWCDEGYERFIHEKFPDYINSFADKLFYDYEKANSKHFNLERVRVN
ncbi:hypothetical protein PO909_003838 [Leuciscus waleckii]